MEEVLLNDGWQLQSAPLFWDGSFLQRVKEKTEGWYECTLPADVRVPLIKYGVIKDPVLSDYCFESEWVEKKSWWYFKTFDSGLLDMSQDVIELVLERLDTQAAVYFNGTLLGIHNSVHYPFVKDIKTYIQKGKNEIAVRITTGMEKVQDEQLSQLNWAICREQDNGGTGRSDYRRAFVRRPQYTVGWDWGPRVVTCGITGKVYIRGYHKIAIRQMHVWTKAIREECALIFAEVCVENLNMLSTISGSAEIKIFQNKQEVAIVKQDDILLTSGDNYFSFELEINEPRLWWPNGYGEQPIYKVVFQMRCPESMEEYEVSAFGIRTIELDTSRINGENRKFQLLVNGLPIFCKGGDWIPSDSIYSRVTDHKVKVLLDEAAEANFNMLRIWGGGLYESDFFYDYCTKKGLLIWQDFMFACAAYPDHLESFSGTVRKELEYQTKRLRNFTCLTLFCGSNENHWLFNHYENPHWGVEFTRNKPLGLHIANCMAKEVIHNNCREIPYWNSSPYGGILPNDDTIGDVHRWRDCGYMSDEVEKRIDPFLYDEIKAKFVSEYGCIGPCCMDTIQEYMDCSILEIDRDTWKVHCNVFEKDTVEAGIKKHYLDNVKNLSMDDYILYGGMVQSHILEYSLETMRSKFQCYGALVWMYNDTWGETGWTIIDYYTRRKISYYGVKRALRHVKCIIRKNEGKVQLIGCNDSDDKVIIRGEWGYILFDGIKRDTVLLEETLERGNEEFYRKQNFWTKIMIWAV